MNTPELYQELLRKEQHLSHQLVEMKLEMEVVEKNIQGQELDSLIPESLVQSSYQQLWQLQADYDQTSTELRKVQSHLIKFDALIDNFVNQDF